MKDSIGKCPMWPWCKIRVEIFGHRLKGPLLRSCPIITMNTSLIEEMKPRDITWHAQVFSDRSVSILKTNDTEREKATLVF